LKAVRLVPPDRTRTGDQHRKLGRSDVNSRKQGRFSVAVPTQRDTASVGIDDCDIRLELELDVALESLVLEA
jgi:hypothetical protein